MTTETKKTKQQPVNKFRVIPHLSLRGKDIMTRLKNRSLMFDTSGNQYSTDEQIDATRRMSKLELTRTASDNRKKITAMQQELHLKNEAAKKEKLSNDPKP